MRRFSTVLIILFSFCLCNDVDAQIDSILSKIHGEMDFRFRAEQDWDSRKSDGSFRDDRTRLRYRLRTGLTYAQNNYRFGFRIRTGDQRKQQDPQLTLGKGLKEFGTLPLGFEKLFFAGKHKKFSYWLGKNSFPFDKNNELFWSDNVFPEGIFVGRNVEFKNSVLSKIGFKAGHFILSSNGQSLSNDAYMQGVQTSAFLFDERLKINPALFRFRNIPNIPDGGGNFDIDYTIFHLGGTLTVLGNNPLKIGADLYHNFENYDDNLEIDLDKRDQKYGYTFNVQFGNLKEAKNIMYKICYANIQQYAIVDYMAQNDWARWDYSSNNSPDGRVTNFKGVELVAGIALSQKMNIIAKYYIVKQLIPNGSSQETGQRIRFDLNVKI